MLVMMPRPAQPTPGSGPPDSVQRVPLVARLQDVVEFDVLALFAKSVEHGLLGQSAQEETGGVGLGVASDHHDLLAHLRQRGHRVLRGGALADAAFSVDCDLAHASSSPPVGRILSPTNTVDRSMADHYINHRARSFYPECGRIPSSRIRHSDKRQTILSVLSVIGHCQSAFLYFSVPEGGLTGLALGLRIVAICSVNPEDHHRCRPRPV
jgi:hypothetical protein